MDTIVYPARPRPFDLNLLLNIRRHSSNEPTIPIESEPILEDTPDALNEDVDVDYSVHPPDVGTNILVNECGSEVAFGDDILSKQKRVVCSFSSNSPDDPDEYPFDAVTYGESPNCLGLPYNDHSYIKNEAPSTVHLDENRLSLLAKLALAKDSKQVNGSDVFNRRPQGQTGLGLIMSSDGLTSSTVGRKQSSIDAFHGATTQAIPVNAVPMAAVVNNAVARTTTPHPSVITTNSRLSVVGGRAFVLSPAQGGTPGPPLQVHRVSSSLTPHIVLRTGIPALQISTTATRASISAPVAEQCTTTVRCICCLTHTDGPMVQCEHCRTWQHSKCISPSNGTRVPSPHICPQCQLRLCTTTTSATIQRHKFLTVPATSNSNIHTSRASEFDCLNNSGHLVLTSTPGNSATRQLHVCHLPSSAVKNILTPGQRNQADFATLRTTCEIESGGPRYFNLVTHSPSIAAAHHNQSVRSSKRKQDLVTLSGASHSIGFNCVANSPNADGLLDLESITNSTEIQAPSYIETTVNLHSAEGNQSASTAFLPATSTVTHSLPRTETSLHRLLVHDKPQHLGGGCYQLDVSGGTHALSPSSPVSLDSIPSSPFFDTYEDASDLRLSERFFLKLESLFPSPRSPTDFTELAAYLNGDSPPKLPTLKKCQVVNFDFNRKGLVASDDLCPREPVIEYRGLCMLMSEYSELYDYRRHYNPFVLFYKNWSKVALCIDARKFGNEARFIRRSCTPNCEVRHFVTVYHNPQSGPTPRIRLVIFATRPISRSTELTLPFDFDYTTCRYLVKCACARKACPIARWFRQASAMDGGDSRSPAASLLYSRNLPLTPRGSGPGSRPRGFGTAIQDNYSDILADDCDRMDHLESPGWMDCRLDVEGARSLKIRPHRTFKRLSRLNGSDTKDNNNLLKPIRHFDSARTIANGHKATLCGGRSKAPIKNKAPTRRGRPPGKSNQLNSVLPTSGLHQARVRRSSVASSKASEETDACSHDLDDLMRTQNDMVGSSGEDAAPVAQPPSGQYSRSAGQRNRRFSTTTTDPGDVGDFTSDTGLSSPFSGSRASPDRKMNDANLTGCFKQSNSLDGNELSVKTQPSSDTPDHLTSSKSSKSSFSTNVERSKPRSDKESHASPTRKPPPQKQEDERKKSREDLWMAEVLRRIERMEKKRQQKQRQSLSECGVVSPNSSASSKQIYESNPVEGAHSNDASLSISAPNVEDVGPTSMFSGEATSDANVNGTHHKDSNHFDGADVKSDTDSVTMHPAEVISSADGTTLAESHVDDSHLNFKFENTPDSVGHTSPTTTQRVRSTPKRPSNCSRKSATLHQPSAAKCNRRRSQAALLSDGLSDSVGSDHHDTREERWLKSQLRRIAELEVRSANQQLATGTLTESGSATTDHRSPTCVGSPDATATALKDVSFDDGHMDSGYCNSGDSPRVTKQGVDTSRLHSSPTVVTRSKRRRAPAAPSSHTEPGATSVTSDTAQVSVAASSLVGFKSGENCNPNHSPNSADAAADCELIVYRPREMDPMAKFSRSRSVEMSALTPVHNSQEDTPPSFSVDLDCTTNVTASVATPTSSRTTASMHSTLRPTKKRWLSQKATVKQPSEEPQPHEMRKVRVSLSEYRRRRGLSSSSSSAVGKSENGPEQQQRLPVKGSVKPELNLPHQLPASPTRLLDEIPRLYQQFQLPDKHLTSSHDSRQLVSATATFTDNVTGLVPMGRPDATANKGIILGSEVHSEERGPHTPSEPLDDDDTEGTNTVYVRRSSKSSSDTVPETAEIPSGQHPSRFTSLRLEIPADEHSVANTCSPELLSSGSKKDHNDTGIRPGKDDTSSISVRLADTTRCRGLSRKGDFDVQRRPASLSAVPPPPPLPASAENQLVDYAHRRRSEPAPLRQPTYSASEPTYSKPRSKRTSLDYFIRRDQEIRQWQETRSFEREHRRSLPKHHYHYGTPHPVPASFHTSSHHHRTFVSHRSASFRDAFERSRLPDVELTLDRLHDCLRSQLDRTKQALTPQSTTPTADCWTPSGPRGGGGSTSDFFAASDHGAHRYSGYLILLLTGSHSTLVRRIYNISSVRSVPNTVFYCLFIHFNPSIFVQLTHYSSSHSINIVTPRRAI
ncbi:unnamed protein product [Dicrocoelium dendriticum]|nr:unnamed protein product [Dicrocoelium dendriticum]